MKRTIQATKKERIDPETLAKCYEIVDYDEEGQPIYQLKKEYRRSIWGSLKRGLLP